MLCFGMEFIRLIIIFKLSFSYYWEFKTCFFDRYTSKASSVYAIVLEWPKTSILQLQRPKTSKKTTVTMLGLRKQLKWSPLSKDNGISIDLKDIGFAQLPSTWAWAFELQNLENKDS